MKMYIVKFSVGEWDDYFEKEIFVTDKKSTARKYVAKFNKIIKKWKKYYSKFEDNENIFGWIKDEYAEQHFYRWNSLRDYNKAYFEEIDFR